MRNAPLKSSPCTRLTGYCIIQLLNEILPKISEEKRRKTLPDTTIILVQNLPQIFRTRSPKGAWKLNFSKLIQTDRRNNQPTNRPTVWETDMHIYTRINTEVTFHITIQRKLHFIYKTSTWNLRRKHIFSETLGKPRHTPQSRFEDDPSNKISIIESVISL